MLERKRGAREKHSSIQSSASPQRVPAQCEISSRNQGSNGSVRSDTPETAPPTPPNACPSPTRWPPHSLSSSTGCLCESYQIIHILEREGVYTWLVTVCPAYPLSPWLDLNASALILPPGLRNGRWLINASRTHKHRAIARGESARIEIENVQMH